MAVSHDARRDVAPHPHQQQLPAFSPRLHTWTIKALSLMWGVQGDGGGNPSFYDIKAHVGSLLSADSVHEHPGTYLPTSDTTVDNKRTDPTGSEELE